MKPLTSEKSTSLALRVKSLRISMGLSRQQLARKLGITPEEVELFEDGLPVPLNSKLKLIRQLWARRACDGK